MVDSPFSPEYVAERIGYPFPVVGFGLVKWERPDYPDYAVATSSGAGEFLVEVWQKAEQADIKLARLLVPCDGSSFDGFIFGCEPKDIPGPEFVVDYLSRIIATMGPPSFMDTNFPSRDTEEEQ